MKIALSLITLQRLALFHVLMTVLKMTPARQMKKLSAKNSMLTVLMITTIKVKA